MIVKIRHTVFLCCCILLIQLVSFSQNEAKKWCFGNGGALDFMTVPPSAMPNSSISTFEGCSSIADASGNLLFYTDGVTVYDQFNNVMAGGTGLMGFSSSSQSGVIVKQPGNSNIYYIFTQGAVGNGVRYSIVDMSLAAGLGSVTSVNNLLISPSSEKLTSARHCNGIDVWVLTHSNLGTNFQSYLVTSAGVNVVPVVSSVGSNYVTTDFIGILKLSPNGKKLAASLYGTTAGYEIYDFDPATGVVSNPQFLGTGFGVAYGVEFSPDCSKLYGTRFSAAQLYQWDLCAGTTSAIAASVFTVHNSTSKGQLQLGTDGKIYVARSGQSALGVINNPNQGGAACNYVDLGQAIGGSSSLGLPNFITSAFNPPPPAFTYSINCQTVSFTAPPSPSVVNNQCAVSGYSLSSLLWNFGDAASGAANTSTLTNPTHIYSAVGSFTTQLTIYYTCGGGIVTQQQTIPIVPCVNITSSGITCASLGSASVSAFFSGGPFTYSWQPVGLTGSVVTGLYPATYTVTATDVNTGFSASGYATIVSPVPFSGILANSSNVNCPGASTGTASIQLFGGSGNETYTWSNGVNTQTTPVASNLGSGTHSVLVIDALTSCSVSQTFYIFQPPSFFMPVNLSSPSVCAGGSVSLQAYNSGGTPGYSYTWTAGPASNNHTVSETLAGTHIYTINSTDAAGCLFSSTVGVDFVPNPTLTVTGALICPGQTATLNVSGASSYTWNNLYSGNSYTDTPAANTVYSVTGEALGCYGNGLGSAIIKPVPVLTLSPAGNTVCAGKSFSFSVSGGTAAVWNGPSAFSSLFLSNTIPAVVAGQAGVYQTTVTAVNNCTASGSVSLTVNPLPLVSISPANASVCVTSASLNLTANGTATQYTWQPAASVTVVNNQITTATPGSSSVYSVTGSLNGCTATAQSTLSVVQLPVVSALLSTQTVCALPYSGSPVSLNISAGGANSYTITSPPFISNSNSSGPVSQLSVLPGWLPSTAETITVTGSNGVCTSSTSTAFTVVSNPTINFVSSSATICAGLTHTFTVNGANAWTWGNALSSATVLPAGNAIALSPLNTAVITVTGSADGCLSSSQSATLTVNQLPLVTVKSVSSCIGTPTMLVAESNGSSFVWSPASWLNNANSQSVVATPPATQLYQVIASLNSCTRSAEASVLIRPVPTAVISADTSAVCTGGTLRLKGSGGTAYLWHGPDNFSSSEKDILVVTATAAGSGFYTLTVSNDYLCKNTTSQQVVVHARPNGMLQSAGMSGCVPFCADYRFSPTPGMAPITELNWSVSSQTYSGTQFNRCFTVPGAWQITGALLDANGCTNTVAVTVNAFERPEANFIFLPERPVQLFDEVSFYDRSAGEGVRSNWFFINNRNYRTEGEKATYTFPEAGVYPVALIAKNKWGCTDSIVRLVTVIEDNNLFVPDAFTPDGDGLNDIFQPKGTGFVSFELLVFDRWGSLVFQSEAVSEGWDGSFKGQPVKSDVYVWQIRFTRNDGARESRRGHVTLYR